MVRTYRVLLAGAEPRLRRALRDAGFELIVLDSDAAGAAIATAVIQEDVDAVGIPGGEAAGVPDDVVVFDTARADAAPWLEAALDRRQRPGA